MNKNLANLWKKPKATMGAIWKRKLVDYRKQETLTKIEKPTRPDRARSVGYKAKQGYVVVRVKVDKGTRKIPKRAGGRTPKASGRFFSLGKSKQVVAEEKAARKYKNLEVLNSYYAGEDGKSKWYEVILIDPYNPSILKDREKSWIFEPQHKGRAQRGKTSAGKKSRGLRNKGKGAEKIRPSLKANRRRGK